MNKISRSRIPIKWSVRARLLVAIVVGGIIAKLLPSGLHWSIRSLVIWDAGMICFLAWSWVLMLTATPDMMQRHARLQDTGRWLILSLITAAACISVLAIAFLIHQTRGMPFPSLILHVVLATVTIIGSWLLVHTIFASHYASLYYQENKTLQESKEEGLDFPGDLEPDYWDFLYFSFVIGMTSQVSDVAVRSRSIRRLTLLHGILAFFFNTTLLAMTINIVAGLI